MGEFNRMHLLDRIPFELDAAAFAAQIRVAPDSDLAPLLREFLDAALPCARPKAIFLDAFVERRDGDRVTVGNVTFASRVLAANLRSVHRLFPYVATCGHELDLVPIPRDDFVQQYWLDALKAAALRAAVTALHDYLASRFALTKASSMSPGSGDADIWPIQEQRPLFSLFGDTERLIGVRLTDSYLMVPNKTVSGIRFPSEVDFRTCRLCHRKNCPSRAADFDRDAYELLHGDGG
jgi:hypothetical protein